MYLRYRVGEHTKMGKSCQYRWVTYDTLLQHFKTFVSLFRFPPSLGMDVTVPGYRGRIGDVIK